MPGSMEAAEQSRNPRPRWKNYPEAIEYILKRTIPEHPIPRGKYRQLFPQVAIEVNEKFDFGDRKADAKGVKYVTEKYGSDPVFGNRKMQVVHPAKGKSSTREKKTLMRAKRAIENGGGNLILCPHCEGNGFIDTTEALDGDDDDDGDFQDSLGVTSGPPSPTHYGGYGPVHSGPANPVIGTNSYQGLQPSNVNPGAMISPTPMAHMPNAYHGPPQSGQVPQYLPQASAPSALGDNNAYDNVQGTVGQNPIYQDNGIWDSMNNAMNWGLQNSQAFNVAMGEVQPASMPLTNQPRFQGPVTEATEANTQLAQGQIVPGYTVGQRVDSSQIDPALRSGTFDGPLSSVKGKGISQTRGSGLQPRYNEKALEERPNDKGNIGLYGNAPANHQTANSVQPRAVASGSIPQPQIANGGGVDPIPNAYSTGNVGLDYGLDPTWLNQPLNNTNNTPGDNSLGDAQNFIIDGDFDFSQFLNENQDFLNF